MHNDGPPICLNTNLKRTFAAHALLRLPPPVSSVWLQHRRRHLGNDAFRFYNESVGRSRTIAVPSKAMLFEFGRPDLGVRPTLIAVLCQGGVVVRLVGAN